ncbi:hypothetical protein GOP47_0019019 [Adiantum capillus-veneris]|uniref:Uncharacterized protein n=1 Tax=Adiantum capillus-veneris TaxID=13818 RepID=A0A9D4UEH0_ADICA|nr:hypothetical protein GOP47_0019019 [Adiantum capillus-veneris]
MGNMELACPRPLHPMMRMGAGDIQTCRPFRKLTSCASLLAEGEPGHEILDILLDEACLRDVSGSPIGFTPFCCGSPPVRASNPLIHDVHFTQKKAIPSPLFLPQNYICKTGGNSSYKKSSSCSTPYGSKPFVRIEGFASEKPDARGVPAFA